jgi:hypothetical protein
MTVCLIQHTGCLQRHNIDLAKYFTDPEMSLLRIEDCILGRKPAERKSTWGGGEGVGVGVKVFLYDIVSGRDVSSACSYDMSQRIHVCC